MDCRKVVLHRYVYSLIQSKAKDANPFSAAVNKIFLENPFDVIQVKEGVVGKYRNINIHCNMYVCMHTRDES